MFVPQRSATLDVNTHAVGKKSQRTELTLFGGTIAKAYPVGYPRSRVLQTAQPIPTGCYRRAGNKPAAERR